MRIGRGTRMRLQGAVDVVPLLGAIAGCHCSVLWLSGRGAIAGCHCMPLLGAVAGCHCSVMVEWTWCHCWVPLQGAIVVCYG